MPDFKTDGLEIKLEKGTKVVMSWLGISNARDPSIEIDPYVDNVLNELNSREIELDFSRLEYMNSSTVTPIIRMIRALDKKNVKTLVIYQRTSKWQQASFKALGSLSKTLPNVSVEGR